MVAQTLASVLPIAGIALGVVHLQRRYPERLIESPTSGDAEHIGDGAARPVP